MFFYSFSLYFQLVYSKSERIESRFEYIPSYLAFREAPLMIRLLQKMKSEKNNFYPDVSTFCSLVDNLNVFYIQLGSDWKSIMLHLG